PHRPGIAPALGLRAGGDDLLIVSQTQSTKEPLMVTSLWSRRATSKRTAARGVGPKPRHRFHLEQLEDRCLLSFTTGALAQISNPDPLPNAPPEFGGPDVAAEPYVAVNPTNPKNIVAAWIDHPFAANVASVSFDGGKTWQNVPIPVSQSEGGPYSGAG